MSALLTVCNLCAATITVLFLKRLLNASVICSSDILSSAEVGSSRNMIRGFLRKSFAIANLCFCPPLSLTPFSQIWVSSQSLNPYTKSHFDNFIAVWISFLVTFLLVP